MANNSNGNMMNPSNLIGKSPLDSNPDKFRYSKNYLKDVVDGPRNVVMVILGLWGVLAGIISLFFGSNKDRR